MTSVHRVPRRSGGSRLLAVLLLVGAVVAPGLAGTGALPQARAEVPVTLMAAGDIAGSRADAGSTGDLIRAAGPDAVLPLGDNAYPDGSLADHRTRYEPTWGSFKGISRPVPGNHEYRTPAAQGYVDYFGAATVRNPVDGGLYYAWDVGNGWRAYAVNTDIDTSGAQLTWLRADLAANPGKRYLLYTHHPRYTSALSHPPSTKVCPLWNALAGTGRLEIVLASHNHHYERFAPMDCAGRATAAGVPSFVVGSGGNRLAGFGPARAGSLFRNAADYGVLRLDLTSTSWSWSFIASGRGWNGSASVSTGRRGVVLDRGTRPVDPGASGRVDVRIAAGADDAEQRVGASTTIVADEDLDLGVAGAVQQVVGLRFAGVRIPQGARITAAHVRFTADEVRTSGASLTIRAEDSRHAAAYTSGARITARPVTGQVGWTPPGWPTVGVVHRTPDLAALVQAVVDRTDWAPGNALALQVTGSGQRVAESFEGSRTAAPLLHVEFTTGA